MKKSAICLMVIILVQATTSHLYEYKHSSVKRYEKRYEKRYRP